MAMGDYCLGILIFSKKVFDEQAMGIFNETLAEFLTQLGLFSPDAGEGPRVQIISADLDFKNLKDLDISIGHTFLSWIKERPKKDGLGHLQNEKLPFDINDLLRSKDSDDYHDNDDNQKDENK